MDWKDIDARLCDRAEEVCRHLFPQGQREGGEFVVGSVNGEEGKSLKVNLAGKAGLWRDFAGESGGKSLCSLWMHARGLRTFGLAVKEAKEFLIKCGGMTPQEANDRHDRVKSYDAAGHRPAVQQPDDSGWKQLTDVWAKCQPLTEGGPVWNYLVEQRRLAPEVLTVFEVREYLTQGQWAMVFPYFPTPVGPDEFTPPALARTAPVPAWLKFELLERVDGKKKEWTTRSPEKSLFGVQLAGHPFFKKARHLLIGEGEKDALSWASYGCHEWHVLPVSVPFGAKWQGQDKTRPSPNREWLDRSWDWIENFETVFVAMDGDEAGQRAALDIITEIGPRRCRQVTLPEKEVAA